MSGSSLYAEKQVSCLCLLYISCVFARLLQDKPPSLQLSVLHIYPFQQAAYRANVRKLCAATYSYTMSNVAILIRWGSPGATRPGKQTPSASFSLSR